MTKAKTLRVAVIGAGASGIATAIRLREMGVTDIAVFEKWVAAQQESAAEPVGGAKRAWPRAKHLGIPARAGDVGM